MKRSEESKSNNSENIKEFLLKRLRKRRLDGTYKGQRRIVFI